MTTPHQPKPHTDGWQDIATAPKDGTYIILACFDGDYVEVTGGDWNMYPKVGQEGLHGFRAWIDHPTHWMPLPPLPKPPSTTQSQIGETE